MRFKAFLIAITAQVLEAVVLRKIDVLTVAFREDRAKVVFNSLVELVAAWGPLVDQILSFVSTQVTPQTLSEKFSEESFLPAVSKTVSALLYSGNASAQQETFAAMIADA